MVKVRSVFRCGECGGTSPKWAGRCPTCGEWNTLAEEIDAPDVSPVRLPGAGGGPRDTPVPIAEVDTSTCATMPTGIDEVDRVLSKIDAVLPQRLRPGLKAEGIEVLAFSHDPGTRRVLSAARRGMKERRKLSARYIDLKEHTTQRVLWPLGLFYWGKVWTLAAWCELRSDYRSFRIDRFAALDLLPVPIPDSATVSLQQYLTHVRDDAEGCLR